MLPVLIGQRALNLVRPEMAEPTSDYDLIMTRETAADLVLSCGRKIGQKIWFDRSTNESIDYTIAVPFSESSDCLIMAWMNSSTTWREKCLVHTIHLDGMKQPLEVLVPPLIILYAIKKAHLVRSLFTPAVWMKHVKRYLAMREALAKTMPGGYTELDEIVVDGKQQRTLGIVQDLYRTRLYETLARVGDTPVSMDKMEDEFFDDNVPRYVKHDDIHVSVARALRGTDELLFKQFQNPDVSTVALDRVLFMNADYKVRIQAIVEEVLVLVIERKFLPVLHNGGKIDLTKEKVNILNDVYVHYATNLCGQGESFLRRWVIDHTNAIYPLVDSHLPLAYNLAMSMIQNGGKAVAAKTKRLDFMALPTGIDLKLALTINSWGGLCKMSKIECAVADHGKMSVLFGGYGFSSAIVFELPPQARFVEVFKTYFMNSKERDVILYEVKSCHFLICPTNGLVVCLSPKSKLSNNDGKFRATSIVKIVEMSIVGNGEIEPMERFKTTKSKVEQRKNPAAKVTFAPIVSENDVDGGDTVVTRGAYVVEYEPVWVALYESTCSGGTEATGDHEIALQHYGNAPPELQSLADALTRTKFRGTVGGDISDIEDDDNVYRDYSDSNKEDEDEEDNDDEDDEENEEDDNNDEENEPVREHGQTPKMSIDVYL